MKLGQVFGSKDLASMRCRLTVDDNKKSNVVARSSGDNMEIGASSFWCVFGSIRRALS